MADFYSLMVGECRQPIAICTFLPCQTRIAPGLRGLCLQKKTPMCHTLTWEPTCKWGNPLFTDVFLVRAPGNISSEDSPLQRILPELADQGKHRGEKCQKGSSFCTCRPGAGPLPLSTCKLCPDLGCGSLLGALGPNIFYSLLCFGSRHHVQVKGGTPMEMCGGNHFPNTVASKEATPSKLADVLWENSSFSGCLQVWKGLNTHRDFSSAPDQSAPIMLHVLGWGAVCKHRG